MHGLSREPEETIHDNRGGAFLVFRVTFGTWKPSIARAFQLSCYAAELAEREGIDVGLFKRNLDLSPRERVEQSQQAASAVLRVMEAGKRLRNGR